MQIPRWGRVVAQPHEFLIHIKDGRVKNSGQGASCFKWPGDSVALVSTSVAKLSFSADQVTREKVGVEVTGLAVYRIAEPLLAYRMIDGETARLTEILRDMFVGATRRIVAGLSLEECITHRKERVASALLDEIAPVLAGQGAVGDTTYQGWGVVIDTIEIQNVRVLSEEVFHRLQAPYREALALDALKAREQVAEEQARITVARQRAEEEGRREMMAVEEVRVVAERQREIEVTRHKEALAKVALEDHITREERKQSAEQALEQRKVAAEIERQRRQHEEALAKAERAHQAEIARARATHEAEVERARAQLAVDRDRAAFELETKRLQGELDAELGRLGREARGELTDKQLEEVMLVETLPRMAEAFRGTFGEVSLTAAGGSGGELFGFLSAGLDQVARATSKAIVDVRAADRGKGSA